MDMDNARLLIRQSFSEEEKHFDPPVLQSLKQASMRVACYSRCAIDLPEPTPTSVRTACLWKGAAPFSS